MSEKVDVYAVSVWLGAAGWRWDSCWGGLLGVGLLPHPAATTLGTCFAFFMSHMPTLPFNPLPAHTSTPSISFTLNSFHPPIPRHPFHPFHPTAGHTVRHDAVRVPHRRAALARPAEPHAGAQGGGAHNPTPLSLIRKCCRAVSATTHTYSHTHTPPARVRPSRLTTLEAPLAMLLAL